MTNLTHFRRMPVLFYCLGVSLILDGSPLKGFPMADLSNMKNLRGGTIYSAASVAPTTARTWAINLGTAIGTGHPRYDVSDVVAVILMRELTTKNMMAAGPASIIVNALHPIIAVEVERIAQDQRIDGRWTWEGGKFAVITRRPEAVKNTDNWMKIVEADQIGNLLVDRGSGSTPTVISILRLVNIAIYALQIELANRDGEAIDG